MKKIKLLLIFVVLTIITNGCVSESRKQTYAWPLATASTEETMTHVFSTTFANEVARLSDGEMRIQVYPQSILGGDRELMESCKDGDIPFVTQSPAPQVSFMGELAIFDIPCLFNNVTEIRERIDNVKFMQLIQDVYQNSGYKLLGISDQGFRVMTAKKPIRTFKDFEGQKIRTMENLFHIQFWQSIRANPTPMTFSEVYIGLQQGTIDAQENAYELIVSAKLYEQQKYVIDSNVVPDYITLIVSDKFYNSLPEHQQKIIDEAASNAQTVARTLADDRIAKRKQQLIDSGVEIVELNEETWKQMQEASQPVYESIRKKVGDEIYNEYVN